jgi:hypothetical protein
MDLNDPKYAIKGLRPDVAVGQVTEEDLLEDIGRRIAILGGSISTG